jgi:hypothetical protein
LLDHRSWSCGRSTRRTPALVELAEDRGRPVSHYLAALPLAAELHLAGPGNRPPREATGTAPAPLTVKVCAGTCQRWGALDLLDHLAERAASGTALALAPVSCLDRCDQAPACEVHGPHGQLVVAPATPAALDEAIDALS